MSDAPPPPPYGSVPHQPPYGAPTYPSPYAAVAPDHPQATLILILGIVSIVGFTILGPVAWILGNRALAEIDASNGRIGGRGNVSAGRICGIIGTVLLGLTIVGFVLMFTFFLAAGPMST